MHNSIETQSLNGKRCYHSLNDPTCSGRTQSIPPLLVQNLLAFTLSCAQKTQPVAADAGGGTPRQRAAPLRLLAPLLRPSDRVESSVSAAKPIPGCGRPIPGFAHLRLFSADDREEKSEEQNRDVSGNVADRAEDYLESLLTDAFKGKGFEKISKLLQEGEVEPPQKYSESLFSQLDKALRKELDKNEFQNVSLLLKCIQLYLKSDLQEEKSLLIEQGLVAKLVSWFERARAFVTLIDPKENKFLMLLLEDFFDTALVICKCSNEAVFYMETSLFLALTFQNNFLGKKDLVNLFLPELGHLVTEANLCCALHLEALRTLNSILDEVPREERKKFPLSEEMCLLTKDLAKTILEVGDYDLQVALSEALCRLMIKKWRDDLVHHWFEDNYLAEAFKEIKDREFETDCRKFLNLLNERLGNERRVYSFPCISAFADTKEVKKPSDEKLEEFWIDFNTGSESVTFYVDSNEGSLWDSVRLSKEAVSSYSLEEDGGQKIVKIFMKIPAALIKTEATKIKLFFSAEFEILSVLKKVLGDEKIMTKKTEEKSDHAGKQAKESEAVIPESSNAQRRKDPSNAENMETLSDNLTSENNQQLTHTVSVSQKMVNSSVAVVTVSQQTDLEDAKQGSGQASVPKSKAIVSLPSSAKKSKPPSPGMKAKPSEKPLEEEPGEEATPEDVAWERRNRKTSLAKQKAEGRKEVFDFENSDSSSHEKVTEAKGKILGQKTSQNQRNTSLSSYRKHLFSESNNENTSTGQSEKSWILDSQLQSMPKSVDYTRKRTRVRSKLKVLPMSSASSGSDHESKKEGESRQRTKKETLRKRSRFSTKGGDLPTVDTADEMLSKEPKEGSLSPGMSAKGYSSDAEKVTQLREAPENLTREEESAKQKDSDILEGTVAKKLKVSSWETNHASSDTNYKPRKIFDSVEEEVEIKKGHEMDDSVDDVFFSKMQHEDFSHTGVITAFETFVDQMKKLFWTRYKRMEISTQNALRSSEKNLSALLNQIHECRLNKLDTFQKIVVDELSSLEKETQILANMEKDAVDFWNAHLLKLNSFCNQQKQRIESVDSALGESAKSFTNSIQNTTHEHPVKKAEESNVFVISSD
ncbi:synaptonemal complex protein 2-like [Myiozetetes cayanensis]|uniref:synaptonemal complex protein 2-like n=1 Tax=Myiozetetes cayanensis TaxID=478635 RepID=UPI0021607128|nr:synaptonemal complex protein 2-like [Myiozetetes cayanensis]